MAELKSFLKGRKPVTFVDLFAGAGGISEGFLQADANNKYFDFLLASDINENCEVTHRARYNKQLGLQTQFITEDIMSPDFIPHLVAALKGKQVDVVTGGPSCQSFSLAGRRKRFDKRDNLFDHYLKVIRTLKPKYFVMENVKGILTKDKGRFKVEIMKEMRSIINDNEVPNFIVYVKGMLYKTAPRFLADAIYYKLSMELETDDKNATEFKNLFFENLANQFKLLTRQIEYRVSKSDRNVNTIRHGIEMLRRNDERAAILARITNVKTAANIDNDMFAESINSFMTAFSDDSIIDRIIKAIDMLDILKKAGEKEVEIFKQAVIFYTFSLDECFEEITKLA
ncbi:MAG: DNA cytosine methyltransferase, partial [Prevotella sp.]|nr:DNA cytosine methyltransferase [Prevotella sp.]